MTWHTRVSGYYHNLMLYHIPSKDVILSERVRGFDRLFALVFYCCEAVCKFADPDDFEVLLFPHTIHRKDGERYNKEDILKGDDIRAFNMTTQKETRERAKP